MENIKNQQEIEKNQKNEIYPNCLLCRGKGEVILRGAFSFNCPSCNNTDNKIIFKKLITEEQIKLIREGILGTITVPYQIFGSDKKITDTAELLGNKQKKDIEEAIRRQVIKEVQNAMKRRRRAENVKESKENGKENKK